MQVDAKVTDTNRHRFYILDKVTSESVWICDGWAVAAKVAKYINVNRRSRSYTYIYERWCERQLVTLRSPVGDVHLCILSENIALIHGIISLYATYT